MSLTMIGVTGIICLVIMIFIGMNIGLAMLTVGFFGFALVTGLKPAVGLLQTVPYTNAASYGLSVVPLFVLMGELAFVSGMSGGLYEAARKWLARLPGGLACATLAACAGFAAICGSTAATAATMGTVALPEMRKSGYDDGLSTGSLAAGGTLGILIPPSAAFIVYGIISEQSIGRLFAAGVIPGILMAVLYILTVVVRVKMKPSLAPKASATTWKEKFGSLPGLLPVVLLFAFVIGGMFSGIFTATEAAGAGAFASFLYMVARKRCTWHAMVEVMKNTVKTTSMIFLILIGAYVLGYFLAVTKIPMTLASFVSSLDVSRYVILLLMIIIYVVLGCIMDALAMIMLTVPIFLPIMMSLGFDPIWFGVNMVLVMEMGLITPPVGLNVYVIGGVAKDVPLPVIFKGVAIFIIPLLLEVVILAAFPGIALFLPNLLYGVAM